MLRQRLSLRRLCERLDVLTPTNPQVHRGILIYAHGGRWVAVNREVLMQSITPFVRAGYTVLQPGLPPLPKHSFLFHCCPFCVLWRGYASRRGARRCSCSETLPEISSRWQQRFFESRAAAHVCEAAANSRLLGLSTRGKVLSLYRVLDQTSWRVSAGRGRVSGRQDVWEGQNIVLGFCFDCYRLRSDPLLAVPHRR